MPSINKTNPIRASDAKLSDTDMMRAFVVRDAATNRTSIEEAERELERQGTPPP